MEDDKNLYKNIDDSNNHRYHEETAAEIATPYTVNNDDVNRNQSTYVNAKIVGYIALASAILSLFFAPLLLGIIGIILGFVAQRKGEVGLGAWSIGISTLSIIVGMFILPFF